MDDRTSFGTWLMHQRTARGLPQDALARRLGCATVTLQQIELDEQRPSQALAARLADVLEIPPAERRTFLRVARGDMGVARLPGMPVVPPVQSPALPTGTVTFLFTDIAG